MRGCLFVLVVAAALVGAIAWFAAPPIAAVVIRSVLDSSGYHADSTAIGVEAAPPPRVLFGQADVVTIDGTAVSWRSLRARTLDLRLEDVDLFARSVGLVHGTIDGAEVGDGADSPRVAIVIDGPGTAATAQIVADRATVRTLVLEGLDRAFNVEANDAELLAPDRLRISAPGATFEGLLVIDGDRVVAMSTPLGSVPLLTLDPSLPLRLTGVTVVDAGLRLDGILDVAAMLG